MNNFHQMFGSSWRQLQFRPPFRDPELYQSICYLGVMARSRKKSHRGKLGEQMLYCKGRHQNWCDVRPCHGSGRMGDVFNNSLFKQAGFTPQFNWKLGRTLSPLIHQLCFFHDSVITTLPSNTHEYSLKCFHSTSLLQSPKPRNKSNSHRKNKYKSSSKNKTMKHSKGKEHHHNHPLRLRTGIPDPIEEQQKSTPKEIPPAYLTRTASPFVYISKCAVMDEQTGEVHFNPMALYSDLYPNSSISTSTGQSTSLKKTQKKLPKQTPSSKNPPLNLSSIPLPLLPPLLLPQLRTPYRWHARNSLPRTKQHRKILPHQRSRLYHPPIGWRTRQAHIQRRRRIGSHLQTTRTDPNHQLLWIDP